MAKFSPLSATPNDSQPSENNRQRRRKRRTVSITAASPDNYKVGPGRPPKEYQFKPGQSGNPKGAKRKPPSLLPDLKRVFEQALSEKVTLRQGENERNLTVAEVGIKQLVAQFAKGDRHARRDVFAYAEMLGIDLITSHRTAIEGALASDHEAILLKYVERQYDRCVPLRGFSLPLSSWTMIRKITIRTDCHAQRPRRRPLSRVSRASCLSSPPCEQPDVVYRVCLWRGPARRRLQAKLAVLSENHIRT